MLNHEANNYHLYTSSAVDTKDCIKFYTGYNFWYSSFNFIHISIKISAPL